MCEQVELPVQETKVSNPDAEGTTYITDVQAHEVIAAAVKGRGLIIVPRPAAE